MDRCDALEMWGRDHGLHVTFGGNISGCKYAIMDDIKGHLLEIDFEPEGDQFFIPSGKDPNVPSGHNWYLVSTCKIENPKYFELLESALKRAKEADMNHYCPQCMDEMEKEGTDAALQVHRCSQCGDTYCWHFMKGAEQRICLVCGSEKNK